jgi:hypothetical protein
MTRHILKIILLVVFAGLTVGLTGCTSVVITTIITTPTQSLPLPGSPQKSSCGGVYYTWVNYYNGGAGYKVNTGPNYTTVYANGSPVPTTKYFVAVTDIGDPRNPTRFCVTNNAANQMYFTGSTNDLDLFTVCFKDSSYGNRPMVYMVIKPTP